MSYALTGEDVVASRAHAEAAAAFFGSEIDTYDQDDVVQWWQVRVGRRGVKYTRRSATQEFAVEVCAEHWNGASASGCERPLSDGALMTILCPTGVAIGTYPGSTNVEFDTRSDPIEHLVYVRYLRYGQLLREIRTKDIRACPEFQVRRCQAHWAL